MSFFLDINDSHVQDIPNPDSPTHKGQSMNTEEHTSKHDSKGSTPFRDNFMPGRLVGYP